MELIRANGLALLLSCGVSWLMFSGTKSGMRLGQVHSLFPRRGR